MKSTLCIILIFFMRCCSNNIQEKDKLVANKIFHSSETIESLNDFNNKFDLLQRIDSLTYFGQSIPNNLNKLLNLTFLSISAPYVNEYPKGICELSNLKTLWLDWNLNVTALPSELGKLRQLEQFSITKTRLKEIPVSAFDLIKLKSLRITWCPNITTLPVEIGKLSNLEILDLSGDNITLLPVSILNCKSLKKLGLFGNPIKQDSLIALLRNRHVEVYLDSYIK